MDIGTQKEPGRELGKAEVAQVSGGDHLPDEIAEEFPGEGGCVPMGIPVADGG
jgi:hypothetical protein